MFAQDLPWHISLCQLCPAPGHFFDLLIVRKTLFGSLQLCPSKDNSLKLFLCKSYLTMHFYVPVNLYPPIQPNHVESKLLAKQKERLEYGVYFVVLVVAGFYLYSSKLWLSCKYLLSKVLLLTGFKQNFLRTPCIRRHFGRKKFGK